MPRSHQTISKARRLRFTEAHRELLIERLEEATADGRIAPEAIAPLYDAIMQAMFPEEFDAPHRAAKFPTDEPLGSEERMQVYAERIERGERIYHSQDAGQFAPAERYAAVARVLAG